VPRQEERQIPVRRLLTVGLIVLVVVVWLAWWQSDRLCEVLCGAPDAEGELAGGEILAGDEPQAQSGGAAAQWEAALAEAEQSWTEWVGEPPEWPDEFVAPQDCAAVEQDLIRVCGRLDEADYVRSAGLSDSSCRLIRQTIEELARRPPVLASELKSYESILANVFHGFRTLGARRLNLLREIAREEQDHAELIALVLYRWMVSRESCARSGQTPIATAPLYDYASFLFQTLGGQAYLRRRSPQVEAPTSFYALLILDRAVEQNHNPHGVDPRPEILRTRELLEAQPLVFGDRYLALLDEMDERWKKKD
jgi:hypothetical protein